MEQYGHMAEIRIIGKKWLTLLKDKKKLVQQFDPFNGTPCVTRSEGLAPAEEENGRYAQVSTLEPEGYGPTILSALEYITYLCGVYISKDRIQFSAVCGWPATDYTQKMFDHSYRLVQDGQQMRAYLDEQCLFTCTNGVSVTTDMDGHILYLWGIESEPCDIILTEGEMVYRGRVEPNWQVRPFDGGLKTVCSIAFDYPAAQ